jgi:hypothetical protein
MDDELHRRLVESTITDPDKGVASTHADEDREHPQLGF